MHKHSFLSLFAVSFIFLLASYFSEFIPTHTLLTFLLICSLGVSRKVGKEPALIFAISSIIYFLVSGVEHISTIYMHMSFLSFALHFLWPTRAKLISGCGSLPKRIGWGVAIFFLLLIAAVLANSLTHVAGVADQEKIVEVVSALPLYLLIASFTLGPLSEELLFRAFLVPRSGVILPTILFSLTHAAYGSIAELAGAFLLGFVLANAYYYLKDPLPCIVAHAMFNFLSVVLIVWVY